MDGYLWKDSGHPCKMICATKSLQVQAVAIGRIPFYILLSSPLAFVWNRSIFFTEAEQHLNNL